MDKDNKNKFINTMEETTINDRVQQIIDHYNLNRNSFSREIGLSNNTTISNIVGNRKSKPGYDILRRISERFLISPSWLLLGKGPMLLGSGVELESDVEVDNIANAILRSPERFEKNPVFAKYLEAERAKAIIEHYDNLMKSRMSDIDLSDIKPKTKTD